VAGGVSQVCVCVSSRCSWSKRLKAGGLLLRLRACQGPGGTGQGARGTSPGQCHWRASTGFKDGLASSAQRGAAKAVFT
jgi:hypothetical protein